MYTNKLHVRNISIMILRPQGFSSLNFPHKHETLHSSQCKEHKEMESIRDSNMDLPDHRQIWEAPSQYLFNMRKCD